MDNTITKKDDYFLNISYKLKMLNDFYKGGFAVRKSEHLTKWTKEDEIKYKWRLDNTYYMNFIKPTVNGINGMIHRKKPTITNENEVIIKNIDLKNTSFLNFSHNICKNAVINGLSIIVVHTNKFQDFNTKLEEKQAGIRFYFKQYDYNQVISMQKDSFGNLSKIIFSETVDIDNGNYGSKKQVQFIEYTKGGGKIYTINKNNKEELKESWTNNLDEIPISICYTGDYEDILETESILLDICLLNKTHYNLKSGVMNIVNIASNPIPVIYGSIADDDKIIGVNQALVFDDRNTGGFEWVEINGSSIKIANDEIKEIEEHILRSSLSSFTKTEFKTATESRNNNKKNLSTLTYISQNLNDCLNLAFRYGALLTNTKEIQVEYNTDFDDVLISEAQIKNLIDLRNSNNLSLETLLNMLVKGEILPDNIDLKREQDLISSESSF